MGNMSTCTNVLQDGRKESFQIILYAFVSCLRISSQTNITTSLYNTIEIEMERILSMILCRYLGSSGYFIVFKEHFVVREYK